MANRVEARDEAETCFTEEQTVGSSAGGVAKPGIPSKAAINGHPIHPIVVTLPVAFLTAVLATDLAARKSSDPFWARASRWLLGSGLVTGLMASAVGLVDFLLIDRVRSVKDGWIHLIGNGLALFLSWRNLQIRLSRPKTVPQQGLILSTLVSLILGVTGWYGGQLIYKHKIAVNEDKE